MEINVVKNIPKKSVKIMNGIKVNAEEVIQKNANTSSYSKDVNSMTFVHFPMLFHSIW